MHWWKIAKLETFEDRNITNEQILKLQALSAALRYAVRLVYQTARGARKMADTVRNNKTLSSYDSILGLLAKADMCAMDSPLKFGIFCTRAANEIDNRVSELEQEREDFSHSLKKRQDKKLGKDE